MQSGLRHSKEYNQVNQNPNTAFHFCQWFSETARLTIVSIRTTACLCTFNLQKSSSRAKTQPAQLAMAMHRYVIIFTHTQAWIHNQQNTGNLMAIFIVSFYADTLKFCEQSVCLQT